ncbi:hypothetical protein G6557_08575 [Dermacoccus nishinomiyaensis]|nr:hypothetical protein [Dermacoccus nishinomiyaensis]
MPLAAPADAASGDAYLVGAGLYDITGAVAETGAFGYAANQTMTGLHARLYARLHHRRLGRRLASRLRQRRPRGRVPVDQADRRRAASPPARQRLHRRERHALRDAHARRQLRAQR